MIKTLANRAPADINVPGLFLLLLATLGAAVFFLPGLQTLGQAWQKAEYSHGPLIPLLSTFLLLRELKSVPVRPGEIPDRGPGLILLALAFALGLLGSLSHIGDISAYALILWVGGMLLVSFGWRQGRTLWPSVLHLVFMLPLPSTIYYKVTIALQFVSSEIGVWALQKMGTPVFLDGNIIDLGVYQLHVAEACSGLRYMFPIMSFSYIFAALYRGPVWHKAVLLLSAVPLAVLMNSFRIALVGVLVNTWGIDQAEGLAHLMEGWVIFLSCILILFALAMLMLRLQPAPRMSLSEALDLDFGDIWPEVSRLRYVRASPAMMVATSMAVGMALMWTLAPSRPQVELTRQSFASFPRSIEDWTAGPSRALDPKVEKTLGADDYLSLNYASPASAAPIEFFSAWYLDQTKGGIHSPEVCLPGGGWEMDKLEAVDIGPVIGAGPGFNINRAVIIKEQTKLLVYYWFDQSGRHIASDYLAKMMLVWTGLVEGRTDGALVRLTTPILPGESERTAEARLNAFLTAAREPIAQHVDR